VISAGNGVQEYFLWLLKKEIPARIKATPPSGVLQPNQVMPVKGKDIERTGEKSEFPLSLELAAVDNCFQLGLLKAKFQSKTIPCMMNEYLARSSKVF